jgi:hypothetical protein
VGREKKLIFHDIRTRHRRRSASDVPEEVILVILSDFRGKKLAEVLKRILGKLKELGGRKLRCESTSGSYRFWPGCVI